MPPRRRPSPPSALQEEQAPPPWEPGPPAPSMSWSLRDVLVPYVLLAVSLRRALDTYRTLLDQFFGLYSPARPAAPTPRRERS